MWVLDTDGWCYWSQILKPGDATNLLLAQVLVNPGSVINDNYEYFIDVQMQVCNATEVEDMIGWADNNTTGSKTNAGATGRGAWLLERNAGTVKAGTPVFSAAASSGSERGIPEGGLLTIPLGQRFDLSVVGASTVLHSWEVVPNDSTVEFDPYANPAEADVLGITGLNPGLVEITVTRVSDGAVVGTFKVRVL